MKLALDSNLHDGILVQNTHVGQNELGEELVIANDSCWLRRGLNQTIEITSEE